MKPHDPIVRKLDGTRASRRRGGAKQGLIIGLVVFVAILVPVAIYFFTTLSFSNGTTGEDLTVPPAASVAPSASPSTRAATPKRARRAPAAAAFNTGRTMDFLAIDAISKQPLSGIRVQTNGNNIGRQFSGTTGPDGHVKIPVTAEKNPNYFNIRVTGAGYLDKRLQWVSYRPELSGEVPTTCTMEMERITKISGKIVDDAGQPVAGANVEFSFKKKYLNPHEQVAFTAYDRKTPLKSGPDGSWSFSAAPVNCDIIGLTAWDYHHVTGDYWSPQPFTPVSKLYDGTAEFVLNRGVEVESTVLDPQGNPLPGVSIAIGGQRQASNNIPAQDTDAAGKASYFFQPGNEVVLTVQGKGYAPDMQQFIMGPQKKEVTFKLSAAHHITGKVVDSKGNPVRNARFYLQNWRGANTIQAQFQSDPRGMFHWNAAPADAVTFSVSAQNLRAIDNQILNPDQDNLVKLGTSAHVTGTVTDAQTGQPINDFHLTMGIRSSPQQPLIWQPGWNPDNGVQPGGKFSFTNDWSYPGVAVRIEASGYLPVESRILKPDEGDVTLDLKMKPGKDVVLTIKSPDGKPVAGATVVMGLPGAGVYIDSQQRVQNQGTPQVTSDSNGRADFPPQIGVYKIIVMADAGFAKVDQDVVAKSTDITLEPWGRIEGRLMIGSKPAIGQNIDLLAMNTTAYDPNAPRIQMQNSAKTDDDGHFVLTRVSPGSWNINRRVEFATNSWGYFPLKFVEVAAGQTLTVALGGTGRPVVGKIVIPPEIAKRSDWTYGYSSANKQSNIQITPPPMPDDIKLGSPAQQQKWTQDWQKTDAGKAWVTAMIKAQENARNYPFVIGADGSFRIDDVAAGHYTIGTDLRLTTNTQNRMFQPLGIGSEEFDVPEMPGGRSDEALQIPPLTIVGLAKLNVGDTVSDLQMRSADGKALKLSDFRGKYLLFHFRGRSEDASSLTTLNAINTAYGNDSRLAMLSINTDPGSWLSRMFSRSGIAWRQADVINDQSMWMILSNSFGVGPMSPQTAAAAGGQAWLIDPDGKVLARDLTDDAIKAALTTAIGPPNTPATQPTTAP